MNLKQSIFIGLIFTFLVGLIWGYFFAFNIISLLVYLCGFIIGINLSIFFKS